MSIADELQLLSEAHGPTELAAAMRKLQRKVRSERLQAASRVSPLEQTFMEALRLMDAQRAEGVSQEERMAGFAKALAAAGFGAVRVPFKAEDYCPKCDNTGALHYACGGNIHGPSEEMCDRVHPHGPHDYIRECWCVIGKRFTPPPKRGPDDFTAAGKSKPKRPGWSRAGR